MEFPEFTAAAVIASPVFLDLKGTIDKTCGLIDEGARGGAHLMAFPETYIPAYPWWLWMAINNNQRLELYKRLYVNAVDIQSDEFQVICRKAREKRMHVVIGINERDGGTLYNTQVFIDADGQILGKHRKLVPTGEERTVWGRGDGGDLRVFDTEFGKLGGLVCYEHSMALSRYALYAMGEQIHVANWPGANFKSQPRDRNRIIDAAARFIAFEGQIFVINSTSCLSEAEAQFYIELDPSNEGNLEPGGGIAGIVGPNGEYLSEVITGQEGIVYGEIDMAEIIANKHMVDSVGHYARWDVTRLLLNNVTNTPIEYAKAAVEGGDHEKMKTVMTRLKSLLPDVENEQVREQILLLDGLLED